MSSLVLPGSDQPTPQQGNFIQQMLRFCAAGQHQLVELPLVHARLQADPPARIANLGCSVGWSSIGLALAYPKVRVDGFDGNEQAIESAWLNTHNYGLVDRLTFHMRNVSEPLLNGRYDLVLACGCIYNSENPVGVLHTIRRLIGETGIAIVIDDISALAAEKNWDERRTHWLLDIAQQHRSISLEIERYTAMLISYAQQAGFQHIEALPMKNSVFLFSQLHR